MANAKLRCKGCRDYFPREEIKYGFHSDECKQEHRARQRRRVATRNRRRDAAFTPELRALVRNRDGNRCRNCGHRSRLHVHHIIYRAQQGPHEPWNLITLCAHCHETVHSDKKKYQPLLRTCLWLEYFRNVHLSVPATARWLERCE